MYSLLPPNSFSEGQVEAAVIFGAMGNKHRLKMLRLMLYGEMAVGDLARAVGLSHSATSQHLSRLRAVDVVAARREKQTIYYMVVSEPVKQILRIMSTTT